ncbi:hypothetical protein [Sphaerisporangium rufum]|uniref:hypothetical protein n=1 Tax=Sphaerisporangium rufum TaxID=1381558 RepID=UPI001950DBB2|nr:hypothetical protein [Sphaerisporangium rufum]
MGGFGTVERVGRKLGGTGGRGGLASVVRLVKEVDMTCMVLSEVATAAATREFAAI